MYRAAGHTVQWWKISEQKSGSLSGFAEPRGDEIVDPAQRICIVNLVEELEDSFLIIHAITTFSKIKYLFIKKHRDTMIIYILT